MDFPCKCNVLESKSAVAVPVNVGPAIGALSAILFAVVVAKLGSSHRAAASSFSVSNVAGAESVILAIIFVAVS